MRDSCVLQIRQGCEGGGKGALIKHEVAPCLGTSPVETLFDGGGMSNIWCIGGQMNDAQTPTNEVSKTLNCEHEVMTMIEESNIQYAVRRITPIEGERLQGFADNWTRPCFKAEGITDELCDRFVKIHAHWAEIEGKSGKTKTRNQVRKWLEKISSDECPDGPRYKAIGNSMQVNVMMWIGMRIAIADTIGGAE